MKKLVLLLALLLVAMPAMAAVQVTCSDQGGGVCKVSYNENGAGKIRAFALDITVDNGAVIRYVDGNTVSTAYYVAPGSVSIVGGNIVSDIVASSSYAGTLAGEGTGGMTIEMGSLYASGDPAPAASGDLFSFVVDKDCNVVIELNAIRAGVVMEDPDAPSGLTNPVSTCSVILAPPCWGDVGNSDSTPGHDGVVDLGDLIALLSELINNGVGENFTLPAPGDYALADVGNSDSTPGQDGIIDLGDLISLLSELINNGAGENFTLPGCFPLP